MRGNRQAKAEARAAAKAEKREQEAEARRVKADAKAARRHGTAPAQPASTAGTTAAMGGRARPVTKRRSTGPARQTRWTRVLGLVFVIAGFGAIGAGWAGAASKDCTECQLPYLLSGGAIGLGLIGFGVGLMIMAQLRTEGRRLLERLDEWRRLPGSSGREASPRDVDPSAAASPPSAVASPPSLVSIPSPPVEPSEPGPVRTSSAERADVAPAVPVSREGVRTR